MEDLLSSSFPPTVSDQLSFCNTAQILLEIPWQQHYERFWHQGPLLFAIAILAVSLAFIVLERKERFAR